MSRVSYHNGVEPTREGCPCPKHHPLQRTASLRKPVRGSHESSREEIYRGSCSIARVQHELMSQLHSQESAASQRAGVYHECPWISMTEGGGGSSMGQNDRMSCLEAPPSLQPSPWSWGGPSVLLWVEAGASHWTEVSLGGVWAGVRWFSLAEEVPKEGWHWDCPLLAAVGKCTSFLKGKSVCRIITSTYNVYYHYWPNQKVLFGKKFTSLNGFESVWFNWANSVL